MRQYVAALFGGALLFVTLLSGLLLLLERSGVLPPPQFANSLCLDEKLSFMRENQPRNVNLLVIGSSEAWRSFNSPEAVSSDPSLRPYNAGLCGKNIAQSAQVVSWLISRVPSVQSVLVIIAPGDLEGCSTSSHSSFNLQDVDQFVFGKRSKLIYYFKYFDANTLVRNIIGLSQYRRVTTSFNSLYINKFGDGPLDPTGSRGLLYGDPDLDDQCFAEFGRVAHLLRRRNIRLVVAEAPTNPAWKIRYDPTSSKSTMINQRINDALRGSKAVFIKAGDLPEKAFFDAYHIRWSYTPQFTRALLKKMNQAS